MAGDRLGREMKNDILKTELLALLEGGNAHMSFSEVVDDFPLEYINRKPPNTPYSFWHFVEHIRITQWDILEFVINPRHVSPEYPQGYRPPPHSTTDEKGWHKSVNGVKSDLAKLSELAGKPAAELLAPIPHAPGYTILREIILAADHNAYHIGELAILRQVMDIWPPGRRYLTGRPD